MARRIAFLAGSILGVVGALGAAALVPAARADDPGGAVRLVVSCDDATRPRVLEALCPLPVVVHDLKTMERVTFEPVPDTVRLQDAEEIAKAIAKAAEAAGAAAGRSATVEVMRVAIGGETSTAVFHLSDPAIADDLALRLAQGPVLEGTTVSRGAMSRRSGGRWEVGFELRVKGAEWPTSETPVADPATGSVRAIRDAVEANAGELVSVSAERSRRAAGADLSVWSLSVGVQDPDHADHIVAQLNALPSLRVTRIAWQVTEKSPKTVATIEVAARRR
jgi:hypothetical protein